MSDWYGIEGIEFHYKGAWNDPNITFEDITDDANIDVEGTMWERYNEMLSENAFLADIHDGFAAYMHQERDEVRYLIRMARGQVEL